MYEVEQKLWWYQTLHGKVLKQINKRFKTFNPDLKILDAACGTGGLLSFLKEKGYRDTTGFDYSQHAIDFSLERNLSVSFGDLKNVEAFKPEETFDVIICNDALYFLNDQEIIRALQNFRKKLKPGGIILINIHAFEAFSGTHDIAVGSSRRFEFKDFAAYAHSSGLIVEYKTYWPFALSLPIWLVRSWQRYQIKKKHMNHAGPDSDVSYPGDLVNGLLRSVMRMEENILSTAPFGSSLFMVLR
ncbi:class I SAM-dependent methyltransferase [Dyadobacter psychrotolerans]|nr:class I SAM-dependent methyltransferase [Dyadobacter psychrotolerans]